MRKDILGGIINLNLGFIEVDAGASVTLDDEETLTILKQLAEKGRKGQLLKPVAISFSLGSGDLGSKIDSMTSLCYVNYSAGYLSICSYFWVEQDSYTLEVNYDYGEHEYYINFNER